MLTVILTILKILGIIIAVLIGLVLLIVLLVGFVPIRYKASGQYPYEGDMNADVVSRRKRDALMNKVKASDEKTGDEYGEDKKELKIKANAVVSWLLHIVHVTADMDSTGLIITARLFGIFKIYSNDPETVKKKEEKQRKKEEKQREKEKKERLKAEKNGKKDEGSDDVELSDGFDVTDDEKEESVKQITDEKSESEKDGANGAGEKAVGDEEKDSEAKEEKDTEKEESGKDASEDDEKPSFIDKIVEKYEGIKEKLSKLKKKIDYILDMKDDERVRNGIGYAKKKLFLIIRRILPKKLTGRVAFGMDDPATTGYITGGVSVFYGLWAEHFTLEPDFENKKLEADVSLKGRIMLALLVIPALKVWFNRDIKYIRKRVNKFKNL